MWDVKDLHTIREVIVSRALYKSVSLENPLMYNVAVYIGRELLLIYKIEIVCVHL
jgi:hypothetical protein